MNKTIETSKGRFVVIEVSDWRLTKKQLYELEFPIVEKIGFIHNITEKQASTIVQQSIHTDLYAHYVKDIEVNTFCYKSAIQSLHSLLESQGIEITNNTYIFNV